MKSPSRLIIYALAGSIVVAAKLPNIIFIVADDLGWHDVGFRSHQIKTPNIDHFAADGVVLDQYYVQSVCSPTRATFMTGRYPLHNTINDWLRSGQATGLPLNETLIPQKLAEAGYRSHATGKWHLGFTSWEHTPTFRGFDSFVGFYSGGEDYFTHQAGGFDFHRDMQPRCGKNCSKLGKQDRGDYSTFVFSNEAVRIIKEHDISDPLFLYLAYQAVHAPREVPKQYSDAYIGVIDDSNRRGFAGMLTCMDEGIGNVTAALRAKGMLDSSLIVFTTDNGGPTSDTPGGDYTGSRNYPLRGGKHSIWEGGTRGTAVVWAGAGTGLLPDARRGAQAGQLMHGSDWLPTFCSVAGISKSCARLPLDGVDQSASIFRDVATTRQEIYYGMHDDAANQYKPYDTALRDSSGWKLLQGWGGKPDSWSQPVNETCISSSANARGVQSTCGTKLAGKCCPDHDIRKLMNATEDTCCAACLAKSGCVGYTFRADGGMCFIKSDVSSCVDGPCSSASLHPQPANTSVLLFNVHDDQGEHFDISAKNPDIVKRLVARLAVLRSEQVDIVGGGGHPDPSCPSYVKADHVDPDVGQFWEPWCEPKVHQKEIFT